jgi:hypothetical protein
MNSELPDGLRDAAARINADAKAIPGFVSCYVDSESPPVLAYTFDTAESAQRFKALSDGRDTAVLYTIYPFRPTVVFEQQAVSAVDAEWHRLVREHQAASALYADAFAGVSRAFASLARGLRENPAINHLDASDIAWAHWQTVRRHMDEFVRKHTGKG